MIFLWIKFRLFNKNKQVLNLNNFVLYCFLSFKNILRDIIKFSHTRQLYSSKYMWCEVETRSHSETVEKNERKTDIFPNFRGCSWESLSWEFVIFRWWEITHHHSFGDTFAYADTLSQLSPFLSIFSIITSRNKVYTRVMDLSDFAKIFYEFIGFCKKKIHFQWIIHIYSQIRDLKFFFFFLVKWYINVKKRNKSWPYPTIFEL